MQQVSRRTCRQASATDDTELDPTDAQTLEGHEVLSTLETDARRTEDHSDPAKGIAYGIVFGSILWAIAIATYFLI